MHPLFFINQSGERLGKGTGVGWGWGVAKEDGGRLPSGADGTCAPKKPPKKTPKPTDILI